MNYLRIPKPEDETAFRRMMALWRDAGGRINPGLLRRFQEDYGLWLNEVRRWDRGEGLGEEVPQTLYFLKDEDGEIIGALSLRHYLNHTNLLDGGHVAYGVRPDHRGKGYGNLLLGQALKKLAQWNIHRVLVTCNKDNLPSQKVILHWGGVLENEALDEDGAPILRYWIETE